MHSNDLFKILACPSCKGSLSPSIQGGALVCKPCALKFKIVGDIPVMLIDEAEKLPVNSPELNAGCSR